MLCARHWASGDWLNAWTSASGLMAVTLYVACGHAVWVEVMMGGLEQGPSLPKTCVNMLSGQLKDGQRPHGLLTWAVHVRHVQWQLLSNYQTVSSFPDD